MRCPPGRQRENGSGDAHPVGATRAAALIVASLAVLTACAAGPNTAAMVAGTDTAGFWLGLWHGLISPVIIVVSLFDSDVNIYEVRNNGGWYNFGFMIGVSMIFSGGPVSADRARGRTRTDR